MLSQRLWRLSEAFITYWDYWYGAYLLIKALSHSWNKCLLKAPSYVILHLSHLRPGSAWPRPERWMRMDCKGQRGTVWAGRRFHVSNGCWLLRWTQLLKLEQRPKQLVVSRSWVCSLGSRPCRSKELKGRGTAVKQNESSIWIHSTGRAGQGQGRQRQAYWNKAEEGEARWWELASSNQSSQ